MLRDAETPFSVDPNEEHVGACLVYCRGGRRRGEFCLVQSVDDDVQGRPCCSGGISGSFKIRVVTFSLEYDKNGDLTTGGTRQIIRTCNLLDQRHQTAAHETKDITATQSVFVTNGPRGNKKETSKEGMMPTKRRSGERGDGGRTRRQQHLYLLVDDWAWGYSVRKIDLPIAADSESDPGSEQAVARRLPRAVFHFEARHGKLQMAAVGTAIVAVPHNKARHGNDPPRPLQIGQVTAFDVRSRGLAVFPPYAKFRGGPPVLIPAAAGDRLFLLSCRGDSFCRRRYK
ncbi:hypothetical protein EJB05_04512, partial [Eragrostis curvula]